jgi:hypothetical protein
MPGGGIPRGRPKGLPGGTFAIPLTARPAVSPLKDFGIESTAAAPKKASAASGSRAKATTLDSPSISLADSFSDAAASAALTAAADASSSPEKKIAAAPTDLPFDGNEAIRTSATVPKRARERAILRSVTHHDSPLRHKTLISKLNRVCRTSSNPGENANVPCAFSSSRGSRQRRAH